MKPAFERVDFGGHPKYDGPGLGSLNVLFPGRSHVVNRKATKKAQDFNLFDFNPYKNVLGVNSDDFKASKLCPKPSLADLHSDSVAAAAAAAVATATQQRGAGDQAPDSDAHNKHLASATDAAGAAADTDDGRRKRQRLSEDAQQGTATQPAAAAAGQQYPSLQTLTSVSSDNDEKAGPPAKLFKIHEDTSSDEGEDDGPVSSAEAEDGDGAGAGGSSERRMQQQRQQTGDGRPAVAGGALEDAGDGSGEESGGGGGVSMDMSEDDQQLSGSSEGEDGSEDDNDFFPLLPAHPAAGADTAGAGAATSTLQQQQQQRSAAYQPPWLPRLAVFSSPLLRLHNEIVAFCQMLAPTAEEVSSRASSLDALRGVVRSIWPSADVQVFGSYETGLYTPASDTDVVVVDSGLANAQMGLKALAQALEARHLVRNMQLVLSARVPIIKFEMIDSGLAFDVSWEVPSGPQGAAVVKQLLQEWPALKPLALVLKVFLTQRELNEVYTGGVGSYSLIIMIVASLQLHHSRRPVAAAQGSSGDRHSHKRRRSSSSRAAAPPLDANLGLLLLDFLRLYGRGLNLNRVGVSSNDHGRFFNRTQRGGPFDPAANRRRGGFVPPGAVSLCVEDPIDDTNDTARGSFNMKLVRQVFDHAYQLLNAPCPVNVSLLGRIIHLAPVISGRPVPPWCVEAVSNSRRGRSHDHDSSGSHRHRHHEHAAAAAEDRSRHDRGGRRDRSRDRDRGRDRDKSRRGSGHTGSGSKGSRKEKKRDKREGERRHEQRSRGSSRGGDRRRDGGQQSNLDTWLQGEQGGSRGGEGVRRTESRQSFGSDSGRQHKRRRH